MTERRFEEAAADAAEIPGVESHAGEGQILMEESSGTEQLSLEELKRLKADLENDRKRLLRQHNQALGYATRDLVKRVIPVIDHFNLAIEHGEGGAGVQLALKELMDVLAMEGLEEIEVQVGVEFDPAIHHAIASQPDPSVAVETVMQVNRRGYRFKDQVLRAPEVVVSQPVSGDEA